MHKAKGYAKASTSILALLFAAGLLVGGLFSFYITLHEMANLSNEVTSLQSQVSDLRNAQNLTYQNIAIYQNATALADIYANVSDSVVLIQGVLSNGDVQGSGFVYRFLNRYIVITNFHVVYGTSDLSVTFSNGNGYSATVLGTDSYSDLAILSVEAPASEFKPVEIVSSSTLRVGDPVIAIGNPYGLVGSLTTGVVSAMGRTLTEEEYAGSFAIPNIIQTSAPINPGNSGGPLLNAIGKVVGVTTAIVSDSQGLGFAVPSTTILREISDLITTGTYLEHSYLGVTGQDMNYDMAQQIGSDVTYGWKIVSVIAGGPSDGRLRVNDIIIAMNETLVRNNDDLASYLAEKTLPGQLLVITVMRAGSMVDVNVLLGRRPAPPT